MPDDSRARQDELQAICEYLQSRHDADVQGIVHESEALLDLIVAIEMDLHALSQEPLNTGPPAARRDKLNSARALGLEVIRRLHGMIANLQLSTETDFYAGVEAIAAAAARHHGVQCAVELPNARPAPAPQTKFALYGLLRDALSSLAQHARPTQMTIRIETDGDCLQLHMIHGANSPADPRRERFRVAALAARAKAIGGDMRVQNLVDGKTTISIWAPACTF